GRRERGRRRCGCGLPPRRPAQAPGSGPAARRRPAGSVRLCACVSFSRTWPPPAVLLRLAPRLRGALAAVGALLFLAPSAGLLLTHPLAEREQHLGFSCGRHCQKPDQLAVWQERERPAPLAVVVLSIRPEEADAEPFTVPAPQLGHAEAGVQPQAVHRAN